MAFDQYKALLQDANGKISGPRTVIAGFGAGVTESLLAVTPFESIKTTLCVLLFRPTSFKCLSISVESTTVKAPTPACAVSYTLFPSSLANAVSEVSSKASSLRLLDKQLTAQLGLAPTLFYVS